MMKREKKKVEKPSTSANKLGEECQYCKKLNYQKEKCFWNPNNPKKKLEEKREVVINEMAACKQDKVIGKKEKHMEVLVSLTLLLTIFVGNKDMFPLIARGRRRSNKC
jgi:hypothetical protein